MSRYQEKPLCAEKHALGWVSLGVGFCELAAPRLVQRALGVEDTACNRGILRVLGIREVSHAVSLFKNSKADQEANVGLWARVAGDVLDTALLAVAATKSKNFGSLTLVTAIVSVIGAADIYAATNSTRKAKQKFLYWH